jgi:hypothetical protein
MGHVLKRVPLDFQWPEKKVWEGYLNPHYAKSQDCAACGGTGLSPEARRLKNQWYGNAPFRPEERGSTPFTPAHPNVRAFAERNVTRTPEFFGSGEEAIEREAQRLCDHWNGSWSHHLNVDDVAALVQNNRLYDLTHVCTREAGWQPKEPPYLPTPEEVNDWSISGVLGHDAINQWVVVSAECKRLGIDHECPHCQGSGTVWDSLEAKQAAEAWTRTEPPVGDGYQIWETESAGSPISPVFATPEELAQHMAGKTSYDTWLQFINGPGWAPTLAVVENEVLSGVDAVCLVAQVQTGG